MRTAWQVSSLAGCLAQSTLKSRKPRNVLFCACDLSLLRRTASTTYGAARCDEALKAICTDHQLFFEALEPLSTQDVLRPFVLAIESKSSKLVCLALVSVQKLVAADAIALDGLLVVIQDMEQVKKLP